MYVLGKRDLLKKLGFVVGNDLTTLQRKELQELREKGKRGFYRNGQLRIDETPLTRDTPPRRQDQPWRKSTVQQHQNYSKGILTSPIPLQRCSQGLGPNDNLRAATPRLAGIP
ncbi:hypothetical protein ElyMa_006141200 [Elysia marginata]|uniref:Uncharacterized protein n=1 Tax=Elysia marginata TaxID=1093978 RepID=A0AAV4GVX7_9GAST|nr:hypothetical protein ElyMa_006141200 [Elysia marginata]